LLLVRLKMNIRAGNAARRCLLVHLQGVSRMAERKKSPDHPRGSMVLASKLKTFVVTVVCKEILVLSEGCVADAEAYRDWLCSILRGRDVLDMLIAHPGVVRSIRAKAKIFRHLYIHRHDWIVMGMCNCAQEMLHVYSALCAGWSSLQSRYLQCRAFMLQRAGYMPGRLAVCMLIHVSTPNDILQLSSVLAVQCCDRGDDPGGAQ
jgi:hypothetical protein